MHHISDRILLTIWVGSMWSIGYIVAPVLFNMLERQVAGQIAGQLFTIVSYIGLICGVLLLNSALYQSGWKQWRQWRVIVLLVMLFVIVIGQFVLQPMMVELKAIGLQGDVASKFGKLHGISSFLFLINSLCGLALVIAGLSKNDTHHEIAKTRT